MRGEQRGNSRQGDSLRRKALMGKGDADENGIVNTLTLARYVDDQVPKLAQQYFNHPQYPTVETNGQAFPLTIRLADEIADRAPHWGLRDEVNISVGIAFPNP
jgi:hypothetical protein